MQADITNEDEVTNAINLAAAKFGPVDTLIVCSGINDDGLLLSMSSEKLRRVFEANTFGPIFATKAVLRSMLRNKSGSIVLVSSASARAGVKGQANYTASKSALEGLVRTMAKELSVKNLRFNIVAPGATDTDMTAALDEPQRNAMLDEIPMKRFATAEEIAFVIYWVSQSTYMTGSTTTVAGGAGIGT